MTEKLLLNVDEGASLLGLGRSRFYALLASGELQSLKIGRRRLIPRQALLELITRLANTNAEQIARSESRAGTSDR